jgi:hypothetical protein
LFSIFWKVHVKKGRSLGWRLLLCLDWLVQKFLTFVEQFSCVVKFLK